MKYKFILFSPWLLKSPVQVQEGFRVWVVGQQFMQVSQPKQCSNMSPSALRARCPVRARGACELQPVLRRIMALHVWVTLLPSWEPWPCWFQGLEGLLRVDRLVFDWNRDLLRSFFEKGP